MALKLIVGLGNPGREYARTRHNVGFVSLDVIAGRIGAEFKRRKFKALIAEGDIAGQKLVLAKPQTYMNLSGESVRALVGWYRLKATDFVVIHDDLDLPLGRIRIRESGSAGGHKGMQSIISWLKTQEIARIRIGVGHPSEEETIDYVLAQFRRDEKPVIQDACLRAADAVETILREGIVAAMNKYNR